MVKNNKFTYDLTGNFLVAMPHIQDPRFSKSIIFICGHEENGSMGLMINQSAGGLMLNELLTQLGISIKKNIKNNKVAQGGPIEVGRGFVLHSKDYIDDSTVEITDNISLTATTEILQDIASGNGPEKNLVILGYSGWSAGQLEKEMESNDWIQLESDENIIFETLFDKKWQNILFKAGIDPSMISDDMGHS